MLHPSPHPRRVTVVLTTVGLALALALASALTGCTAQDSTGRVSVTVSADSADHPYEVQVLDSHHQLVEHQRVFPGGSADFAGVPLGRVTVRASDLCSVHTKVGNDAVTTATLGPTGC